MPLLVIFSLKTIVACGKEILHLISVAVLYPKRKEIKRIRKYKSTSHPLIGFKDTFDNLFFVWYEKGTLFIFNKKIEKKSKIIGHTYTVLRGGGKMRTTSY